MPTFEVVVSGWSHGLVGIPHVDGKYSGNRSVLHVRDELIHARNGWMTCLQTFPCKSDKPDWHKGLALSDELLDVLVILVCPLHTKILDLLPNCPCVMENRNTPCDNLLSHKSCDSITFLYSVQVLPRIWCALHSITI